MHKENEYKEKFFKKCPDLKDCYEQKVLQKELHKELQMELLLEKYAMAASFRELNQKYIQIFKVCNSLIHRHKLNFLIKRTLPPW